MHDGAPIPFLLKGQMRLLLVVLVQALLLLWMYHLAVTRNHRRLRYYIAQEHWRQMNDKCLWVRGGYGIRGFHLCTDCVQRIMA